MRTNTAITIYHLNEDGVGYSRKQYLRVSLLPKIRAVAVRGGLEQDCVFSVRIPTLEALTVEIGDYVRFGLYEEDEPDKKRCRKVIGFSDLRRGGLPHWRLECV